MFLRKQGDYGRVTSLIGDRLKFVLCGCVVMTDRYCMCLLVVTFFNPLVCLTVVPSRHNVSSDPLN